ncbi:unnamed protein product, partial [Rhizoctonia solani]
VERYKWIDGGVGSALSLSFTLYFPLGPLDFTMADFFSPTLAAPFDKAVSQKSQQTGANTTSGMTNQLAEATQSTKASGSNFSMCEIIM